LFNQFKPPTFPKMKIFWLIAGLFVFIIVLEYSTPPPYVFGYLYIGAVLLASAELGQRATLVVTIAAVFLTLLNLWVPGIEPMTPAAVANRTIAIIALIVTGALSDRIQHYKKAIARQHLQIVAQSQLAKTREDFVSTLTHDLKTPLLGAIETLNALQAEQLGPIAPTPRRAIEIMMRSHQTTLQLLETLMDVYRNDAEGVSLQFQPVDIVALAEEAIAQLTALASSRQVHIHLGHGESDFRQSYGVKGDPLQLQRVLTNLIANAVNHSLRGGRVEVVIKASQGNCLVQVLDRGQGIHASELPLLFDQFYQGHSDRQAKGTGLGLYLSRQIVEAHGGKIWAESRSPRGAIFTFCLPIFSGQLDNALPLSSFPQ
jgi:two-component system NarL family sensor kinase